MPRRKANELRPISVTPHYLVHPEGSALIAFGDTKVICTASVEDRVPPWMAGKGRGWVTGEYDMLPRATSSRNQRDAQKGKIAGRTQEISRLIGRALRAVVDLTAFGERVITVDCDVIQADGGTRTAAITGGYVALALALKHLQESNQAKPTALKDHVAAVSVGIVGGEAYLDLDYSLDSRAEVDMNVVMTGGGDLVEVQGTAEGAAFGRDRLDTMLDLALDCLPRLVDVQKRAIETPLSDTPAAVTV
jgi:ribonuclease PH